MIDPHFNRLRTLLRCTEKVKLIFGETNLALNVCVIFVLSFMLNDLRIGVQLDDVIGKRKPEGINLKDRLVQPNNNDEKQTQKLSIINATQIIAKRFTIVNRLGSGGFGEVYSAKDRNQNDLLIAVKFEPSNISCPQLLIEKHVFEIMYDNVHFPKMFYFGTHDEYTILAMDLLGPSVEDLLSFCGRRFSPKTICMIVEQVLRAIETLHNRSLVHRDLKPENFLFGLGIKSHLVHLIDFGLCKNYRHPLTYEHQPYRTGKLVTGTARYCSLNTHHGIEQSRRDDIECLAYTLIYLSKGSLPWMSCKNSNRKKRNEKFMEMKGSLTSKELYSNLPHEFELFYQYSRALSFTQQPDYAYLRNLLFSSINRSNVKLDYIYDWHLIVRSVKEHLDSRGLLLPETGSSRKKSLFI